MLWNALVIGIAALILGLTLAAACSVSDNGPDPQTEAVIVDHASIDLEAIQSSWITQAKQTLHIAYGHTSHGCQLTSGKAGLVAWRGEQYAFNYGGNGGALDLRDYSGNFGGLGIADDLGAPDRSAWEHATRTYLIQNPTINVIIWAWCNQVDGTENEIRHYLDQ